MDIDHKYIDSKTQITVNKGQLKILERLVDDYFETEQYQNSCEGCQKNIAKFYYLVRDTIEKIDKSHDEKSSGTKQ